MLLAILIYIREKNSIFLIYIFALFSWTINNLWRLLDFYFNFIIKYQNIIINMISKGISQIALGVFCILFPILVFKLLQTKVSKKIWIMLLINAFFISLPFISLIYIYYENYNKQILIPHFIQTILSLILFSNLTVYMLIKLKQIQNKEIKFFIKLMAVIQFIFYPLMIVMFFEGFDFMKKHLPYYGMIVSSLFYFIINFCWLLFVSKHLHFPKIILLNESENIEIFTNIYSISKREEEVIKLLIEGKSYKQISDKLFISFETV